MFWHLTVYKNGEIYISQDAKWRDDICYDIKCKTGDLIGIESIVVDKNDVDDDIVEHEEDLRAAIMESMEEDEDKKGGENKDGSSIKWKPTGLMLDGANYPYISEFVVEDPEAIIKASLKN